MVRAYYHDDPEAPVLTGQAGTLVNVLKKCLVDGYGNAGQGTWKPPLGWEGVYSGDYQKAAFRATDVTGTRLWLYLDDAGPGTHTTRSARARGYEVLAGLDGSGNPAGASGPFPTVAQAAAGCPWYKSYTADAVARPWILVGDERACYLLVAGNDPSYLLHFMVYAFGDLLSYRPADAYGCLIVGALSEAPGTAWPSSNTQASTIGVYDATQSAHYLARRWDQTGAAIPFGKVGDSSVGTTLGSSAGYAYPSPVDNSLLMAPLGVVGSAGLRGLLPGLYQPLHQRPLAHRATLVNVAGLPGRVLQSLSITATNVAGDAGTGRVMIDLTGPWR